MKRSALILSFFLLSGCLPQAGPSGEVIEGKSKELEGLSQSRIVSVLKEPYLGATAVPMPRGAEFSSGVWIKQISMHRRGSLADLCAAASEMTNLPISVQGGGRAASIAARPAPSGARLDAELLAALGDATSGARSPERALESTSPASGGIRVKYAGTVKGLLDLLASRSGLSWDYSPEGGVTFSSATTRTFTIWAAPGKVVFSNKITNESNQEGSSSSGSSGGSYEDSTISTAQTNTTELSFDIWKDVEAEVKNLLTANGKVSVNQAARTITVSDTAQTLRQVAAYVEDLNLRLSRQIALSIKVWSLEIEDSGEAGVDLGMFFENASVKVFAGASPLQFLNSGGELSAAIVDGKLKNSTALLKALRSVGKATQVTSGGGVVMSNQPVPVQAIRREAYLASSSRSQSEYGDMTELIPGEVTTGFAMTVIPHIMEGRRVVLQYTVNLSSLDDLSEFSSGDSAIQLPKVSTRSFSQRMSLKIGQTLVLAGFEQEIDSNAARGGILGFMKSREYKKSLIVITIATESGEV
ncbi:MAG: secretin N-terminal domain-containing protein [Desulfovibrio sp.]|nr:secretin N-terminal domain-containing protein [Desulfovibrio sp.]